MLQTSISSPVELALASLAISVFAALAYRRESLTVSGAVGAFVVGVATYGGAGPLGFLLLGTFFVTSTALGKVAVARKASAKHDYEKGDTRDVWQVFANGGIAAACAVMYGWSGSPLAAAGVVGGLAAANADTWATELGVLSRGEPRSLATLRRVPRGTSGAVSGLGLAASAGGALLIAAVAAIGGMHEGAAWPAVLVAGTVSGLAGSLADSLAGAVVQAGYECPRCGRSCEGARHCDAAARHVRGWRWMNNDAVNTAGTAVGAGVAMGLLALWPG